MTAIHTTKAARQPVQEPGKARPFNYYPLLGVLLVLLAMVLVYGGLLLLLVDDWRIFLSAVTSLFG